MNFSQFSVKKPVTIWMLFLGIVLFGILAINYIPLEFLPHKDPLKITIFTSVRGGMPSEEVEEMVTKPIEEAMGVVSDLEEITSQSRKGKSIVTLKFKERTDMKFALLGVREKFNEIKGHLPREIEKPVIARYEEIDSYIMILAVSSETYSLEALGEIVNDELKEHLLRIEGVANVDVYGIGDKKVLVEVSKDKLLKYGLSIQDVLTSINIANVSFLMGELENEREKYSIRAEGEFKRLQDIKDVCVAHAENNSVIRVSDLAQVQEGYLDKEMYSRFFKKPGEAKEVISVYVHKESNANTVEVCGRVREKISKIQKGYSNINIELVLDKSSFITDAIERVKYALIIGAVLASLVLFVFFRNFKVAFVIVLTIPVCLFATLALIFLCKGLTLNILSLSGLALGIGMVVDSAIIVGENILSKKEKMVSDSEAVISGVKEVWGVILTSVITTVVVFLPLLFLMDDIRRFYGNLALTVIFSLVVSLFVSVSLLPSLMAKIKYKVTPGLKLERGAKFYERLLGKVLQKPGLCLLIVIIFMLSSAAIFFVLDKEFITGHENNKFTIFTRLETGAKPFWTNKITKDVESVLREMPEIKSFTSRVEGWSSRIYVELFPLCSGTVFIKKTINELRPKLKDIEKRYRGGFIYFSPLGKEFPELAIDIYGHDYSEMNKIIKDVTERISIIPGLLDWKKSIEDVCPEYKIIVDKRKAGYFLYDTHTIAESLHSQIRGLRATLFRREAKEVETVVRLRKEDRDDFSKIKYLNLASPSGKNIYLNQICGFKMGLGPAEIHRKNKNRYIQISALSSKLSISEVMDKVGVILGKYKMPAGYFWEFSASFKQHLKNRNQLIFALILSLLLVYMVLASLFESYTAPFIIMLSVPFAYAGVMWMFFILGMPMDVGVVMGLIMLGGIVVNNNIIIVDKINYLKKENSFSKNILIKAGLTRLRPILITTITTILGLFPLVFDRGASSIWKSLSITVISGLIFSTGLVLIVIPVVYSVFQHKKS
jgi:HAE1 family hydrophobic/amphiphilic exporter-1